MIFKKNTMSFSKIVLITLSVFLLSAAGNAAIKLPALIRDSMVLQRDTKLNVWGWADAGEKVAVKFNGKTYRATADADGKWIVVMAPQKAGGPFHMEIAGSNKIVLKDILVGDVWFCSGQSNMVHQLKVHDITYEKDIADANNPMIRHFFIPTVTDLRGKRADLPSGYWKSANPVDVREFSAVAYFFAQDIYEKYKIPIGLINASVGGTPVEAWTSEEGFKNFPEILSTIGQNKDTGYVNSRNRAVPPPVPEPADKGLTEAVKWFDPSYVPKGWHTINVPGYWEDQGVRNLDGAVWYRKEIDVPASMATTPAKLLLGRIVDADIVYINGKQIGNTTYQYPQRRYAVPQGILKAGKNLIVVRVINTNGKGGFVPDKPYSLIAGNEQIDLRGEWSYKVGQVRKPPTGFGGPMGISAQNQPTALFNAMVAPAVNYNIKGFLWYQGEANANRAAEYASTFAALIRDWRQQWKQDTLPFLFVQLPGFMDMNYLPSESQWAQLRESQLKTLAVPYTAMAVAIDLGEWNDIHPDNKKDVGLRLALAARKLVYGENALVASGPSYSSQTVDGNKIILQFTNTGGGLVSHDGEPLSQFAIAGADKKFVWAKAIIEGDKIIVWSEEIKNPLFVRYAWSDNPDGANLYNKEGLPASPFRTDQ